MLSVYLTNVYLNAYCREIYLLSEVGEFGVTQGRVFIIHKLYGLKSGRSMESFTSGVDCSDGIQSTKVGSMCTCVK